MSVAEKKQYNLLDALKIVAAFFVVCIHVHFPGDLGRCVIAVARFAVPFFFMVSGFFSYYENKSVLEAKYKRKIKHVVVLLLGGCALYFPFGLAKALAGGSAVSYLGKIFSLTSIAEFLIFNNTSVSEFLWFLPALIYTYVVFFLFEKKGITKKLYFLIPLLFLSGVALREITEVASGLPAIMQKSYVYRNFLFTGLPFFMLGHFIKANEEKLKEKLSLPVLLFMMIAGNAESIAVDMLHLQKSIYVGTFVSVFALFVFAIKYENKNNFRRISYAGAQYSFYVYVIHVMVRDVIKQTGGIIHVIGKILEKTVYVYPFIVFATALVAAAVYVYLKKFIKNKKTL